MCVNTIQLDTNNIQDIQGNLTTGTVTGHNSFIHEFNNHISGSFNLVSRPWLFVVFMENPFQGFTLVSVQRCLQSMFTHNDEVWTVDIPTKQLTCWVGYCILRLYLVQNTGAKPYLGYAVKSRHQGAIYACRVQYFRFRKFFLGLSILWIQHRGP